MLNLIDHLPRDSYFVEAQAADEELAAKLLVMPPASAPAAPRWSEWSPERQALADIVDRLGDLIASVVAAAGGKPPNIPRHPRPVTAADGLRTRARRAQHQRLVALVLPHKARQQEGGD